MPATALALSPTHTDPTDPEYIQGIGSTIPRRRQYSREGSRQALSKPEWLHPPKWALDAFQDLNALKHLSSDWDGQQSPEIDPSAIQITWYFIEALWLNRALYAWTTQLPKPAVIPTPYGGVFVEWANSSNNASLTVECNDDETNPSPDRLELYCWNDRGLDKEGTPSEIGKMWLETLSKFVDQ